MSPDVNLRAAVLLGFERLLGPDHCDVYTALNNQGYFAVIRVSCRSPSRSSAVVSKVVPKSSVRHTAAAAERELMQQGGGGGDVDRALVGIAGEIKCHTMHVDIASGLWGAIT